jgi:hypothetical protein
VALIEFIDALLASEGDHPGPMVVDVTSTFELANVEELRARVRLAPCVLVGVGALGGPAQPLFDVATDSSGSGVDEIVETVTSNPQASAALAILLRGSEERSIEDGLVTESAVYSTLQAGPEFETWGAGSLARERPDESEPAVRVTRDDHRLDIALSRPHVHNAFNARMRDELLDALSIAMVDDAIREVTISGDGPSFCSGGDLDEFGTFPDPATAHLVRLTRSVGRVIASMSERVVARLHGACMGSGIELPAFAGRVIATPDTKIGLPEVGMGLIPGAGGTVSLPRRIGRHRTALLALTRTPIDAATALEWGLVDSIEDR